MLARRAGEDDRCLHVTLTVAAFLKMLTKPGAIRGQPLLPVLDALDDVFKLEITKVMHINRKQ